MSTQHTPTRLDHSFGRIHSADRTELTIANIARAFDGDFSEANARRLVACWNACESIDTEYLEGDESLPHYARRLMTQRDELLAALEKIAGFTLSQFIGPHDMALECVTVACDAIAKVKGGAA